MALPSLWQPSISLFWTVKFRHLKVSITLFSRASSMLILLWYWSSLFGYSLFSESFSSKISTWFASKVILLKSLSDWVFNFHCTLTYLIQYNGFYTVLHCVESIVHNHKFLLNLIINVWHKCANFIVSSRISCLILPSLVLSFISDINF